MDDRAVDHRAAGRGPRDQPFGGAGIAAEGVKRQGVIARGDEAHGIVDGVIFDHRQDRPENLLGHQRAVRGGTDHDRRRHLAGTAVTIGRPGRQDRGAGLACLLDQAGQPPMMAIGDDRRVAGIGARARIGPARRGHDRIGKRARPAPWHEQIVRRDACLPAAVELAERDQRRMARGIGVGHHHAGALAAQFQRHRRQVPRRFHRDQTADPRRAGEEQMVERQLRERPADLGVPDDHAHLVPGIDVGEQVLQQVGRARGQFGGLHEHRVAAGERLGGRDDGKLERIVPGRDDADDALGLVAHIGAAGNGNADVEMPRGRGPPVEVAACVLDRGDAHGDLGGQGLVGRAVAEVRADRLDDLAAALADRAHQVAQLHAADAYARRGLERKGGALGLEERAQPITVGFEGGVHAGSLYRRPGAGNRRARPLRRDRARSACPRHAR